jgi:hypothetical protein
MATNDALLRTSPQQHIENRKKKRNGSDELLQFPANLGAHATLMRFFEYTYGGSKGAVETPIAEILLPLPKQIQDSFKINVQGDEVGVIAKGIAQAAASGGNPLSVAGDLVKLAGSGAKAAGSAAADALTGDFSALKEGAAKVGDAAGFLTAVGASKIAPDITNAIGAGRGTAVNPFATLVFKGVDLKVHSLEWLLSPESEKESRDLKKIIRTLQAMVLPKTDSAVGGLETEITAINKGILRYPAMVNIYLQGIDSNYYFKFKTSMISQLNIDYSPNGVAPLKGGKPSAIGITMTLNEAYIHTASDNDLDELDEEARQEQLLSAVEDAENEQSFVDTSEQIYDSDENFEDQLASDEVEVSLTQDDGSVVKTVMLKEDVINNSTITAEDIESGVAPGNSKLTFRTSS